MEEVAKTCGLAKGTLYLYFTTKEELFLGVCMIDLGDWLDELDEVLSAMFAGFQPRFWKRKRRSGA